MVFHCWFFNDGFQFQDSVYNGCRIAIITVKKLDYRCTIHSISKSEVINLLNISVLEDRAYV